MTIRSALRLMLFAAMLALARGAQAEPGFDCEKAVTKVETLICRSDELSQLDWDMSKLYADTGAGRAPWYLRMQAHWLAQRNRCADAACLSASYRAHQDLLASIKAMDWDNENEFMGVLEVARDQGAVVAGQQGWRKTMARCADHACAKRAYAQRQAVLGKLKKTVARAGMKHYVNQALGIAFDYLENRSVSPCDEPDCVRLTGLAMEQGSPFMLQISVLDGSLDSAAASIWERRGGTWIAAGRGGEVEAAQDVERWQGLHAATMCGFNDRNGFHAGGECNTYLRSNGKRAVIVRDDAASGKDDASMATIVSIRLLR
jgi:uncharacterized protein